MKNFIIVFALIMVFLFFMPMCWLLWSSWKDMCETSRKIKKTIYDFRKEERGHKQS